MEKEGFKSSKILNSNSGWSLVEVMVTMSLMTMAAYGLATQMSYMSKQQSAMNRKIETLEFANALQGQLSDAGFCACNFEGQKFDTAQIATSSYAIGSKNNELVADCTGTPVVLAEVGQTLASSASQLEVASIRLTNINNLSAGSVYSAEVKIDWKVPNGSLQLKPSKAKIVVETSDAGGGFRKIDTCGSEISQAGMVTQALEDKGCTTTQVLGFDATGALTCVDASSISTAAAGTGRSCTNPADGATMSNGDIVNNRCLGGGSESVKCQNGSLVFVGPSCAAYP